MHDLLPALGNDQRKLLNITQRIGVSMPQDEHLPAGAFDQFCGFLVRLVWRNKIAANARRLEAGNIVHNAPRNPVLLKRDGNNLQNAYGGFQHVRLLPLRARSFSVFV